MKNLAGVLAEESNPVVLNELNQAGVKTVEVEFRKGKIPEVRATIIGLLHFADDTLAVFSRHWFYWVVKMTKALPYKDAKALNDLMGDHVRVDGYSGGTDVVRRNGCDHWDVDTQIGLNTLVYVLKRNFGGIYISKEQAPNVTMLAKLHLLNDAFYG